MKKIFDCIEMKNSIREQFNKDTNNMTLKEKFSYIKKKEVKDPIILRFLDNYKWV